MSIDNLIDLQNSIANETISGIDARWDVAVVNLEVEDFDDSSACNYLAFYYVKEGTSWKRKRFELPNGCSKLFLSLSVLTST